MTLTLTIVEGFQSEIEKKISGFGSHIQISNYQSKGLFESTPISSGRDFVSILKNQEGIDHIQAFALKGAILKTDEENYGIIYKGIDSTFKWDFFEQYLTKGAIPDYSGNESSEAILISNHIASKMQIDVGDEVILFFVQQPPRYRKMKISGIYHTGLGEMDQKMTFGDLRHIQKLNKWDEQQVGGFEVLIDDFDQLDQMEELVHGLIDYDLVATSIKRSRVDIFNWLELQDINVIIIIVLLVLVCGIDIISALFILILERTTTIGILKALGASNHSVRKIFLLNAIYLILAGMLIGNILGLGLAFLQNHYGFIKLPQEAYFIDQVPIEINVGKLLLLNGTTLFTCFLMLLIPSNIIAGISPAKTIRFD
jgi:lipoprotein-releasing system permease protein